MKSSSRNSIVLILSLLLSISNASGVSLQELEQSLGSLKVNLSGLTQNLENILKSSVIDQTGIEKSKQEQLRLEEERKRDEESVIKMREERERRRDKRAKEWKDREKQLEKKEKSYEIPSSHVDILILLDTGDAWLKLEGSKIDIILKNLIVALEQKILILCSSTLVKSLLSLPLIQRRGFEEKKQGKDYDLCVQKIQEIKNKELWKMYTCGSNKNLTLFIPQIDRLKSADLGRDLSFNKKKFTFLNWEMFKNSDPYSFVLGNQAIDVNALKDVFATGEKTIRKRIILFGHGYYNIKKLIPKDLRLKKTVIDASIAGLKQSGYQQFLDHLEESGCDFLLIRSCYAGGYNLIDMHKKSIDKQEQELKNYSFIIVVNSVSDVASQAKYSKQDAYKVFFEELNHFLGSRKRKIISQSSKLMLKKILDPFLGSPFNNIPSIKFPVIRSFFRPVDLNERIEITTIQKLLQWEIERAKSYKDSKHEKVYNAWLGKEIVLLYPNMLSVPLRVGLFYGRYFPFIISMIPGTARHYIEEIQYEESTDFITFISQLFVRLSQSSANQLKADSIVSSKAFFIKKVSMLSGKQIFKNVLVAMDSFSVEEKGKRVTVYFQFGGRYYHAQASENIFYTTPKKIKTKPIINFNRKIISNKFNEFRPDPASLYHATLGVRTVPIELRDKEIGKIKTKRIPLIEKKISEALAKKTDIFRPILFVDSVTPFGSFLTKAILNEPLVTFTQKIRLDNIVLDTSLYQAPNRFYFEGIEVLNDQNFYSFMHKFFMWHHDRENNNLKAFFIRSLKFSNKTYKNVILLFLDEDNQFELYVHHNIQNKYKKITAIGMSEFRAEHSIKEEIINLGTNDIVKMLSEYKSGNRELDKRYDQTLKKALSN